MAGEGGEAPPASPVCKEIKSASRERDPAPGPRGCAGLGRGGGGCPAPAGVVLGRLPGRKRVNSGISLPRRPGLCSRSGGGWQQFHARNNVHSVSWEPRRRSTFTGGRGHPAPEGVAQGQSRGVHTILQPRRVCLVGCGVTPEAGVHKRRSRGFRNVWVWEGPGPGGEAGRRGQAYCWTDVGATSSAGVPPCGWGTEEETP